MPHYHPLPTVFQWVLLTLFSYRVQRIITGDSWLPFQAWRVFLNRKAIPAVKENKHTVWTEAAELFSCPYCMGWWISLITFFVASKMLPISLPALQAVAAAGVVGFIGSKDE